MLFFVWSDLSILGISLKRTMPPNTRAVPTQWVALKGFWKYQMEKRRLRNFLKHKMQVRVPGWGPNYIAVHLQVRTRVAVRLGHSAVSTNTADMQRYWEQSRLENLKG